MVALALVTKSLLSKLDDAAALWVQRLRLA
jgi:hypothetical protein